LVQEVNATITNFGDFDYLSATISAIFKQQRGIFLRRKYLQNHNIDPIEVSLHEVVAHEGSLVGPQLNHDPFRGPFRHLERDKRQLRIVALSSHHKVCLGSISLWQCRHIHRYRYIGKMKYKKSNFLYIKTMLLHYIRIEK
jgi:hypothetical protein